MVNLLKARLHVLIEETKAEDVQAAVEAYRQMDGYLRRFKGAMLERLANGNEKELAKGMGLDEKAFLAFIQVRAP